MIDQAAKIAPRPSEDGYSAWVAYRGTFETTYSAVYHRKGPFRTLTFHAATPAEHYSVDWTRQFDNLAKTAPQRVFDDARFAFDLPTTGVTLAGPAGAVEATFQDDDSRTDPTPRIDHVASANDKTKWNAIKQTIDELDYSYDLLFKPTNYRSDRLDKYDLRVVGWEETRDQTIAAFRLGRGTEELIGTDQLNPDTFRGVLVFERPSGAMTCRAVQHFSTADYFTPGLHCIHTTHCTYEPTPTGSTVLESLCETSVCGPDDYLAEIFVERYDHNDTPPPDTVFLPETYGLPTDLFDEPGLSPRWRWTLAIAGLLILAAVFRARRRSEEDTGVPTGSTA